MAKRGKMTRCVLGVRLLVEKEAFISIIVTLFEIFVRSKEEN